MIPKVKQNVLDSLSYKKKVNITFDLPLAKFVLKYKNSSKCYSKDGIKDKFYTTQSKLYFTQKELERIRQGEKLSHVSGTIDGITLKYERKLYYQIVEKNSASDLYNEIRERYWNLSDYLKDLVAGSVRGVSMARMWNISIVSSLIFGMFLMTMIYRYLGQGASAKDKNFQAALQSQPALVLGSDVSDIDDKKADEEADKLTLELLKTYNEEEALEKAKEKESKDYENKIREMVKGSPIEKMVPFIAKKDKVVAAFLVGIAKKESAWGERVPVLEGEDCYNYWGYRGKRARMGTGGHTCFDSPEDAVNTVAKRLEFLVSNEKLTTPGKMVVVWKCGYDCSWDNESAVKKWVSDVDMYFKKLDSVGGK